jgi:hypothetical protein
LLWSTGFYGDEREAADEATRAARSAAHPKTFGDFLAGLFALAREEALRSPGLVAALDAVISGLGADDFLVAVPSLRLAFGYFPPLEKQTLARALVGARGGDPGDARELTRLPVAPHVALRGLALDASALARARRYGLDDEGDRS